MSSRSSSGVVGVVLAGGASRRMGRDKARLELRGESLVERAASRLADVAAEVVVADRGRGVSVSRLSLADGPGAGPAAGILGAADARPGRDLLVLACDLPAVPAALLERLALRGEADAVVPRWHRGTEPLCALYRVAALDALASAVEGGRFALYALLRSSSLEVCWLEGPELAAFGAPERLFANLNTPEDLARLERG
ncbi:MAG: molybdenum cofactor guanylyltransferase [bacterium]|nr:molybdenum cofactor guanylyltransferase [bacterium]